MENITYLTETLTEDLKQRYWRLKQQRMQRCTGCSRRTKAEERCCTAHYLWETGKHTMISSSTGRLVNQPYRKNAR